VQRLVADLNHLHRDRPALHELDFDPAGFHWIDCHDSVHSVLAWLRIARDGSFVVVAANFTPEPQRGYRLGVPCAGPYVEIFNSDSAHYGGSNLGNGLGLTAWAEPWMSQPASLVLTLPPLGCVVLTPAFSQSL
jgi:1,4-alpha-glucan branching enzyme